MHTQELYLLLGMPEDVVDCLNSHAQMDLQWLTPEMRALYFNRATAGEGLKTIQSALGDDPDGMRLLWVLLEMAKDTWEGYAQRGISREIFADTMKFVSRFLNTHHQQQGRYAFVWGWWF